MTPDDLSRFLAADETVMPVLEAVQHAGPSGAYVAAGFVRNRYWDSLYEQAYGFPQTDTDVVYFNALDTSKTTDQAYEDTLSAFCPGEKWEVRNQAHMHTFGGHAVFADVPHALMHWPETVIAVGVRLGAVGNIEVLAPFGLDDLFNHVIRITPVMKALDLAGFESRLRAKGWLERWPNLTVIRE